MTRRRAGIGTMVGRRIVLATLMAVGVVALGLPGSAGAATGPSVTSFVAAPHELPSAGGTVTLTAKVSGASKCVLTAVPKTAGLPKTVNCAAGRADDTVKVASDTGTTRTIRFTATAETSTKRASRSAVVTQKAAAPSVKTFSLSTRSVPHGGGVITLKGSVVAATRCVVSVSPTILGVGGITPCAGTVTKSVTVPADATATSKRFTFSLVAEGPGGSSKPTAAPDLIQIGTIAVAPGATVGTGGSVTLTTPVTGATTCTYSVTDALPNFPMTVPCSDGTATATATIPASTSSSPGVYNFVLEATGPDGTTVGTSTGDAWQSGSDGQLGWGTGPVDTNGQPIGISCPTTTFCAAVDQQGYALTYNGSTWSTPTDIDPGSAVDQFISFGPTSVSCPTADFCVAPDSLGHVITWNGSSWSAPTNTGVGANSLGSVSCPTSTSCVAVNEQGQAFTWNGSSWSAPTTIDPDARSPGLSALSCPAKSFCVAVDNSGNALTYNGTSWSAPADIDAYNQLESVSCPTVTDCTAVDRYGQAIRYDDGTWGNPTGIASGQLTSISCPTVSFCVALNGAGVVLYDGTTWGTPTMVDPTSEASLVTVDCTTATSCTALDTAGNEFSYDGTIWTSPDSIDPTTDLDSVSCPTTTFCAAVGGGSAATYNGTSWNPSVGLDQSDDALASVSCPNETFCVALDRYGHAFMYDGTTWTGPTTIDPAPNSPYDAIDYTAAVSCASATFCAAVDSNGDAMTFDGSDWSTPTQIDPPGTAGSDENELDSVSCPTDTFCVATDQSGNALTYNGVTWTAPLQLDSDAYGMSVSCPTVSFCVAGDEAGHYAGDVMTYDGTGWSAPETVDPDPDRGLVSMSCSSSTFCAALDDTGNAVTYNGVSWSAPAVLPGGQFAALSCPTATDCLGVAGDGALLGYW